MKSWPAFLALSLSCFVGEFDGMEGGLLVEMSQNEAGGSQLVTPGLRRQRSTRMIGCAGASLLHAGVPERRGVRLAVAV